MCESVEEVGVKYAITRAADLAASLMAATIRVQDIRHTDIERDDLRKVITELAGGQGTRESYQLFRAGILKDLLRSFRTSILVTKLCNVDKVVRKYLLYVLLNACCRASERVNILTDLGVQEHSEAK